MAKRCRKCQSHTHGPKSFRIVTMVVKSWHSLTMKTTRRDARRMNRQFNGHKFVLLFLRMISLVELLENRSPEGTRLTSISTNGSAANANTQVAQIARNRILSSTKKHLAVSLSKQEQGAHRFWVATAFIQSGRYGQPSRRRP